MQVQLKDIAKIQFGYYTQPSSEGTIPYLQAKQFNHFGQLVGENDTFVEDGERTNDNLLEDGDILFVSKGFRFFATEYQTEWGKTVASSIFFVIKPDKTKILPSYLVAVLNHPKNLLHFQQSGAGTSIPSIRKGELADFTFNLITFEQQEKIVALQKLYLMDIEITQRLLKEKQTLFQTVLSKTIN
ncbi:restriction endonuclease subunit S [Arcicella rigui]|uniref:Restriction endonuclease subunit S n=1 Tax=Arcicella rigui TaxID=797020 RepID=A0ABU5QB68_9BACT|nr:restriction endonuclease subunit S [Arcicella rigui]MEA5139973.1 restriction endonuclease subunit S [Arcicella rigui]